MRLDAVLAPMIALALGGCLGPEAVPTVTGSVRPTADLGVPASQTNRPKTSLADAVTLCLNRGVPVKTPAFRHCVTDKQETAPVIR